jgi:PiT family inorganic phosphate transporter
MLTTAALSFLVLAILLALGFEFVNGFHDTANAVATVIYTRTLRPGVAVVWSGLWNLIGVLNSSGAVAFAVVALLPVELVLNVGSGAGFAMVFALLLSSIIWNLGTWFLGLPASSSHTLIGSILGVGLANSLRSAGRFGEGVNWLNAREVGLSLLISPILGFFCAGGLLILAQAFIKRPHLFQPPKDDSPPPLPVRLLLILTCTGVSFAHGSNDGQKGMGLMMLILIGIIPATYAINPRVDGPEFHRISVMAANIDPILQRHAQDGSVGDPDAALSAFLGDSGSTGPSTFAALAAVNRRVEGQLSLPRDKQDFRRLRTDVYLMTKTLARLTEGGMLRDEKEKRAAVEYGRALNGLVSFIPAWVKAAVAVALGLGTMVGWKRIVVTVGEKIGKAHLSYGQGASAEFVAMATIAAADRFGLPVSTTHVLSSGVAGTMAANHSGLQMQTVRNLCLAWVFTLPACVLLGAAFFSGALFLFLNVLGLK